MAENKYLSRTPWTPKDDEFLSKYYVQLSQREIAKRLSRSRKEIVTRLKKLSLKLSEQEKMLKKQAAAYKMHEHCEKYYSDSEVKYLIENYSNKQNKELDLELGRTEISIAAKAHDLGLLKSPEHLRKMMKVIIPNSDGHKSMIRPSQKLSDGYILVNVLHMKNTADNKEKYSQLIEENRNRILTNRQNNYATSTKN